MSQKHLRIELWKDRVGKVQGLGIAWDKKRRLQEFSSHVHGLLVILTILHFCDPRMAFICCCFMTYLVFIYFNTRNFPASTTFCHHVCPFASGPKKGLLPNFCPGVDDPTKGSQKRTTKGQDPFRRQEVIMKLPVFANNVSFDKNADEGENHFRRLDEKRNLQKFCPRASG